MIDDLLKQLQGRIICKPHCNGDQALNRFLALIKKKRPKRDEIREAKCFQFIAISRILRAIDRMINCGVVLSALGTQLYRKLLVSSELYRHQQEMYDEDRRRIEERIVYLAKPNASLIAWGKAGIEQNSTPRSQFQMTIDMWSWIVSTGITLMRHMI
jgi:IS5 family transposase